MSPTQPLPSKKEVGLTLLERSSVYVHLDPRQDAVVVPAWLKKQPQLVLQVGMNMPVPIPDLRFDDHGMSCTLSFSRAQFFCVVPWASVFAMVGEDGRGMVWPDDVPAEVAKQARTRATDGAASGKDAPKAVTAAVRDVRDSKPDVPKAKRPRKRPALAAVPDDASPSAPAGPASSATPGGSAGSSASSGSNNATKLPVPARNAPAPVRPIVTPPQASRPVAGPPRRKRELPPYLRVVK